MKPSTWKLTEKTNRQKELLYIYIFRKTESYMSIRGDGLIEKLEEETVALVKSSDF